MGVEGLQVVVPHRLTEMSRGRWSGMWTVVLSHRTQEGPMVQREKKEGPEGPGDELLEKTSGNIRRRSGALRWFGLGLLMKPVRGALLTPPLPGAQRVPQRPLLM
jgi:hypothetical protein